MFSSSHLYLHRQSIGKVFKILNHIQIISKSVFQQQVKKVTVEITKYIYQRIQDSCTINQTTNEDNQGTDYILHNYIRNSLNSVIDEAEIYSARFNKQTILNLDIENIPNRLIPINNTNNNNNNSELIHVQIQNENMEISGKFGWCFVCRR